MGPECHKHSLSFMARYQIISGIMWTFWTNTVKCLRKSFRSESCQASSSVCGLCPSNSHIDYYDHIYLWVLLFGLHLTKIKMFFLLWKVTETVVNGMELEISNTDGHIKISFLSSWHKNLGAKIVLCRNSQCAKTDWVLL